MVFVRVQTLNWTLAYPVGEMMMMMMGMHPEPFYLLVV
jgi:hypothetical protein